METILQTNSVYKIYQTGNISVTAVENASITLRRGEFVAMVGPSGSGKTTMLALIAGLLRPTKGEIIIDGKDIVKMSDVERTRFRREKVGFTFQANNLVPFLTALENVELMLRMNKRYNRQTAEQAKRLLIRLGLEDRLNNLPSQLSGGQQQRVAIARALVHDPAIVLADEPTAALDSERAFQVVQILSELIHEQGRAAIMVTHDLRMVQFADRVIQMLDGKVARVLETRQEIEALASIGQQQNSVKIQHPPKPKEASTPVSLPFPIPALQPIGD
ncbi:MAG: ABC transporter ATP-binding protein [Anaerolineales bacterium]|nr:ABC transporter ATP-binding protein [Anaerolineales bacterium]